MSANKDLFAGYPAELRVGAGENAQVYKRLPGHYAVHGSREAAGGPEPLQTFEDGDVALFEGEPDAASISSAAAAAGKLSPVYTLHPGGSMAVPTGQVFVRFADGVKAEDRGEEIEAAGYKVAQKLAYAPNAAWLRASSGSIADALNGIDELQKLKDVENVEPQMLMHAPRR
jgi:hypothetical protein